MNDLQGQPQREDTPISVPQSITSVAITSHPRQDSTPNNGLGVQPLDEPTMEVTIKFAAESHEYIREYIRNADLKAIFYFSVCSALLAFEHTRNWSQHWMKTISLWSAFDLVTFIAMVGLAFAAACFLFVVVPRLGGSPRGIIFFNAISSYTSADEYISDVAKRPGTNLAAEKLRHCYELATIASAKYSILNLGLRTGAIAIICSLFLLVVTSPTLH